MSTREQVAVVLGVLFALSLLPWVYWSRRAWRGFCTVACWLFGGEWCDTTGGRRT